MKKILLFLCVVFMAAPTKTDAKECFDDFVWNENAGACIRFDRKAYGSTTDVVTGEYVPFNEAALIADFIKKKKPQTAPRGKCSPVFLKGLAYLAKVERGVPHVMDFIL